MPSFEIVYHEAVTIPGDRIVPPGEECKAVYEFLENRRAEDNRDFDKLDSEIGTLEEKLETASEINVELEDSLFEVGLELAKYRFFEGVYRALHGK